MHLPILPPRQNDTDRTRTYIAFQLHFASNEASYQLEYGAILTTGVGFEPTDLIMASGVQDRRTRPAMRPCHSVMVTLSFLLLRRFIHHYSFHFAQQKDLRHKFLSGLSAIHPESSTTQVGFEPTYPKKDILISNQAQSPTLPLCQKINQSL